MVLEDQPGKRALVRIADRRELQLKAFGHAACTDPCGIESLHPPQRDQHVCFFHLRLHRNGLPNPY